MQKSDFPDQQSLESPTFRQAIRPWGGSILFLYILGCGAGTRVGVGSVPDLCSLAVDLLTLSTQWVGTDAVVRRGRTGLRHHDK